MHPYHNTYDDCSSLQGAQLTQLHLSLETKVWLQTCTMVLVFRSLPLVVAAS